MYKSAFQYLSAERSGLQNEEKSKTVHSKKSVRNFECGDDIHKPVSAGADGLCGAGE